MPRGRPFKKGDPRPKNGGRKKGTQNRIPPAELDAVKALRAAGHEPIIFHAQLLQHAWDRYLKALKRKNEWGANGCLEQARQANAEIMKYVYPTRKAVEHSGTVGVTFADFMALAESGQKAAIDVTPQIVEAITAAGEDDDEDEDEDDE